MAISFTAGSGDRLHQCNNLDNNRFSMAHLKAWISINVSNWLQLDFLFQ